MVGYKDIQQKYRIEARCACVPGDKARQPSSGRGRTAEGRPCLPGRGPWAVGRRSRGLSQICGALSRGFPRRSMPERGGCLACHGRVPRSWLFVCANLGRAGPERVKWRETRNEKNENLAAPAGGAGAGGHGHDHRGLCRGGGGGGVCQPLLRHPLGPAAPGGGHWTGPDHKRGVLLPVHRNPGGRNLLD